MKKRLLAGMMTLLPVAALAQGDLLGATMVDSYISPKGAFLNVITPGGSAASAGLLGGDVITSADGKPVGGAGALAQILAGHKAGDRVAVEAVHLGKPGHFTLVLAGTGQAAPQMAAATPRPNPQSPQNAPAAHAPANAPVNVQWTRFADPAEHAFTIEAPAGWRVSGGTLRKNPVEIPMGVTAVSPDGEVTVFYGDPNIPIYSVPSRLLQMGGLREGMRYNMGQGVSTMIEPYMDGQQFASRWGMTRIGQGCASVRLMGSKPRNDSSQAMGRAYAMGGIRTSVRAGEASFSCNLNGKQAGGYVFAATELVQTPQSALWDVKYLVGAIAPAARAAEALNILAHMSASFAIDRSWMARQQQITGQFDQVVAQTNAIVSQRIIDNGKAAAAESQRIFESGQKNSQATFNAEEKYDAFAVRGTSDYVNPETGTGYGSIDNSYAHTYVNNSGDIRQTDSENSPGAGWQELRQVPPGQ